MMLLPPFHSVLEYNWRQENMARPSNSDRWLLCRIVGGVIVIGPSVWSSYELSNAYHRRYDDVEGEDSEEGKRLKKRKKVHQKNEGTKCAMCRPNAERHTINIRRLRSTPPYKSPSSNLIPYSILFCWRDGGGCVFQLKIRVRLILRSSYELLSSSSCGSSIRLAMFKIL